MNYEAHLNSGEKLTLGNRDGHTQIALSSDENGRSAAQNSAFPTGNWSQKPNLFGIGVGFVAQLSTEEGQKWVSIDQNGIHLLDKAPDLSEAKSLELSEKEESDTETMAPMQPLKPMAPMKLMGS